MTVYPGRARGQSKNLLSDSGQGRLLICREMSDNHQLLRCYARDGSEDAFRQLVERYIELVFSTALRRAAGDVSLAQDITQIVFMALARKASSLSRSATLGGWLHRHTCFVASTVMRTNRRRQEREKQAAEMNQADFNPI